MAVGSRVQLNDDCWRQDRRPRFNYRIGMGWFYSQPHERDWMVEGGFTNPGWRRWDTSVVAAIATPHGWPELCSEPPQGVAARVIRPKMMRGIGDTHPRFNWGGE
jgi:hypothetical protein